MINLSKQLYILPLKKRDNQIWFFDRILSVPFEIFNYIWFKFWCRQSLQIFSQNFAISNFYSFNTIQGAVMMIGNNFLSKMILALVIFWLDLIISEITVSSIYYIIVYKIRSCPRPDFQARSPWHFLISVWNNSFATPIFYTQ